MKWQQQEQFGQEHQACIDFDNSWRYNGLILKG